MRRGKRNFLRQYTYYLHFLTGNPSHTYSYNYIISENASDRECEASTIEDDFEDYCIDKNSNQKVFLLTTCLYHINYIPYRKKLWYQSPIKGKN